MRLGEALYAKGDQNVAVKLWQNIIAEDDEHFEALFAYGIVLYRRIVIDRKSYHRSCHVSRLVPCFLEALSEGS